MDQEPQLAEDGGTHLRRRFLTFSPCPYDAKVVQVNRLHILQRFHDYLARRAPNLPPEEAWRGIHRLWLERATRTSSPPDAPTGEGLRRFHHVDKPEWIQFLRVPSTRCSSHDGCPLGLRRGGASDPQRPQRRDLSGPRPGDLSPGAPGSIGYVVVGTFLQDQIIYSVNFFSTRAASSAAAQELIGADEP